MLLWSSGEIAKTLHGVTTRQILDLAEKGFIKPARETTGAGSPRLYDFQNIFEICLCLAVRGRIPIDIESKKITINILRAIREELSRAQKEKKGDPTRYARGDEVSPEGVVPSIHSFLLAKPPFDLLLIACDDSEEYSFRMVSYDETFKKGLSEIKKQRPQNYCTYIIEVSALWAYLKGIF